MQDPMPRSAYGLFAVVCLVWGVPYLFIRVAVDAGLSPAFVSCTRTALGFAVVLPFALRRGAFAGLRVRWRWVLAYTVLELAVPFPLIAWGEQRVASSLAAILVAALPLSLALIAILTRDEQRPQGSRLLGLLVGFAGVVALFGLDLSGSTRELLGAGAVLLATLGYAAGALIIRHHFAALDPLGPICASLGFAALLLVPLALNALPAAAPPAKAVLAIVVLGIVCSAVAFIAFFALIARVGPGRASVITYVNPVVALALGVLFLSERPGPGAFAGLALVLAGSWLATGGRVRSRRAVAA